MTTMRQGIGGAPRLRCARAGLVEDDGDAVRRRAVRPSLFVLVLPGHPHGRRYVRARPWRARGRMPAARKHVLWRAAVLLVLILITRERRRCDVLLLDSRTACFVLPGHPHRAANGWPGPGHGACPQSTGPSGEKVMARHVYRSLLKRESARVLPTRRAARLPLFAFVLPGISTGQPMAGGSRPWGVSRNRPAQAARKVMARHVYRSYSLERATVLPT